MDLTNASVKMNTPSDVVDQFHLQVEIQVQAGLNFYKIKAMDLKKQLNQIRHRVRFLRYSKIFKPILTFI